jgi:hypothetical protein
VGFYPVCPILYNLSRGNGVSYESLVGEGLLEESLLKRRN